MNISTHVGRICKLWYNFDVSKSIGNIDPYVELFTTSIGETLQQKLRPSLKRVLSPMLIFWILNGCTPNSTHPESATLRISPNGLKEQPSNYTLRTLILEGSGTLSDQSLGFRFPNLQTLHIQFTPDVEMFPEDIALWTQIREVRIYGTAIEKLPKSLGDLPITSLRIEHNPYLTEVADLYGPLERIDIANNPNLKNIPHNIGQPETLQIVSLANNQLLDIPDSIGDYNHITELNLYESNMTGSIPAMLSNLTELVNLRLYRNDLTGSMPSSLSALGACVCACECAWSDRKAVLVKSVLAIALMPTARTEQPLRSR